MIFAYHGYPGLVRRLTHSLRHHCNIHVRGYQEEGTTTTPVMNGIDRVPGLGQRPARPGQVMLEDLAPHRSGTGSRSEDVPEIAGRTWQQTGRRS